VRDLVSRERWGGRGSSQHPVCPTYIFQTPGPSLVQSEDSGRLSKRMRLAPGGVDATGNLPGFAGWARQDAFQQVSSSAVALSIPAVADE
jgi:hypothetical protein